MPKPADKPLSRAQAMRAQADALDKMERLEGPFLDAKAAYRDKPTPATKKAYRAAVAKYQEARTASRALLVSDPEPGSVRIVPESIGGRR